MYSRNSSSFVAARARALSPHVSHFSFVAAWHILVLLSFVKRCSTGNEREKQSFGRPFILCSFRHAGTRIETNRLKKSTHTSTHPPARRPLYVPSPPFSHFSFLLFFVLPTAGKGKGSMRENSTRGSTPSPPRIMKGLPEHDCRKRRRHSKRLSQQRIRIPAWNREESKGKEGKHPRSFILLSIIGSTTGPPAKSLSSSGWVDAPCKRCLHQSNPNSTSPTVKTMFTHIYTRPTRLDSQNDE